MSGELLSAELLSAGLLSPLGIVAVAIAGGIGAACRYALDTAVQRRKPGKPLGPLGPGKPRGPRGSGAHGDQGAAGDSGDSGSPTSPSIPSDPSHPRGPLGILLVNLLACLGIGLLAGLGLAGTDHSGGSGLLGIVLASGLLGGFSTFSTVAVDTARLMRAGRWAWISLNTAGMLLLCSAACLVTWAIARQILG